MGSIVSSAITHNDVQADGRHWVRERHVDHLGLEHVFDYFCAGNFDWDGALANRVQIILATMQQNEIAANIANVMSNGSLATVTFEWSTAAQNRTALREAYRSAMRVEAIMIGDFLNTLTDNQLATAFGITTGQAQTLRTNKLAPAADLAADIRAEAGQ